ncbi:unnamed protein product [Sphagnum balticum]
MNSGNALCSWFARKGSGTLEAYGKYDYVCSGKSPATHEMEWSPGCSSTSSGCGSDECWVPAGPNNESVLSSYRAILPVEKPYSARSKSWLVTTSLGRRKEAGLCSP